MADLINQVIGTILLRPYVVAFLLAYLLACSLHLGVKRAFSFAFAGYLVAWLAEYSSIHIGIPFGHYYYIETTKHAELWVAGVPFMDSISFVFLSYAAYSVAVMALSPNVRRRGIYVLETKHIRHSFKTSLLAALLFVYLDIIIDPVSLRGSRWFLGQIYGYPEPGVYFGVPISNFIGWFVVGFFLVFTLQVLDRFFERMGTKDAFGRTCQRRYLLGPLLYASVIIFNLAVTWAIGEYNILWTGIFIVLLPLSLFIPLLARLNIKESEEDAIRAHLSDFPGVVVPCEPGTARRAMLRGEKDLETGIRH